MIKAKELQPKKPKEKE